MTTLSQLAQLQLELINRARMDPAAEAARHGLTSLNQFIQSSILGRSHHRRPQTGPCRQQSADRRRCRPQQRRCRGGRFISHSGIGDGDSRQRASPMPATPETMFDATKTSLSGLQTHPNSNPGSPADRAAICQAVFRTIALRVFSSIDRRRHQNGTAKTAAIASPCSIRATRRSVSARLCSTRTPGPASAASTSRPRISAIRAPSRS